MMKQVLEYTPPYLAKRLISGASTTCPKRVVDFCAGRGNLLAAAAEQWPEAKLFAVDIDRDVSAALPSVEWLCADFLSSRFEKDAGQAFAKKFDVILLNPPFSFHRSPSFLARGTYRDQPCSVAFAFLFTALDHLSDNGELLAIMPTSSLHSDRDAGSRQALRREHNCKIISQPKYDRFPGLDVSTYLMRVTRKNSALRPKPIHEASEPQRPLLKVLRGRISVKRSERVIQTGLHSWIHTTSIKSSKVIERYELPFGTKVSHHRFLPKGSIVVPRVGKVLPGQIAITSRREILSDCLLGVAIDETHQAHLLLKFIHRDFTNYLNLYAGTAAPYTTQEKLAKYIENALTHLAGVYCKRNENKC